MRQRGICREIFSGQDGRALALACPERGGTEWNM